MYEIIADPKDYGIEALEEGLENGAVDFNPEDRNRWAQEIEHFAGRLSGLSEKARHLRDIFLSDAAISATPASLKTLKVQMFTINDAVNRSLDLAERIEADIVRK